MRAVGGLARTRSTSGRVEGGIGSSRQRGGTHHRPAVKKRRISVPPMSEESSEDGDEGASSSGEGDNARDEDFTLDEQTSTTTEDDDDDDNSGGDSERQNRPRRHHRRSSTAQAAAGPHNRLRTSTQYSYASPSSSGSSSSSRSVTSDPSSRYDLFKPLSPLQVNADRQVERRRRLRNAHRRKSGVAILGSAGKEQAGTDFCFDKGKGKGKARDARHIIVESPKASHRGAAARGGSAFAPAAERRAFQVRPDELRQPHAPLFDGKHGSLRATQGNNTSWRKFAGRMMQPFGRLGISTTSRSGSSSSLSRPQAPGIPITRRSLSETFTSTLQPLFPATRHSDRLSASTASLGASFNGKRKRDATFPSGRRSLSDHHERDTGQSIDHPADFADLQPVRRTRSIVRKLEEIGCPVSQEGEGSEDGDQHVLQEEDEEDETESVERSIAEMSLDEISEHLEDNEAEHEDDSAVDEQDDSWHLNEASAAQLRRLRKDKLVALVALLESEDDDEDRSGCTKDELVRLLLDARHDLKVRDKTARPSSDSAASSVASSQEEEADEDDDHHDVLNRSTTVRRYSTRRTRRTSAASSSAPTSFRPSPPRTRKAGGRSKSLPQTAESSAGENDDEEQEDQSHHSPRRITRRRASARGAAASASPDHRQTSASSTDRTPGRLRSGKLRAASAARSSDEDEEEEDADEQDSDQDEKESVTMEEEDEDDVPTPIARRTRHRRNASLASVSSAGFGDDEEGDLPNHEYRLRKVSLPRRGKRASAASVREDEESDDEDDDAVEDADTTVGAVTAEGTDDEGSADEQDEDGTEEIDHDDDFDFGSASIASLMRLRRDDLLRLCRDRDLSEVGTKHDLAVTLLDWYSLQRHNNAGEDDTAPSTSPSASEADDSGDEDYEEQADTSMVSVASADEDDEEAAEAASPAKSARSDVTARGSTQRARNETKTQALAKLSNKRQSYDPASQDKPLLMHSKDDLVHSEKVDTPPGSGDQQDNDLELDLESLNLLDKEIAPDKLKKGEKIGSGGFKDVYEGRYRNVKVALADIRGHLTENDLKELGLLRDLRHENIVRFIGVSIPEQKDVPVTIVTELCTNGDLFDYVRNTPAPPFEKILSIMLNIARGVDYLHKRKPAIIHRDLKSSNVLITAKGVAKISDFGLARVRNSTRSIIKSLVGTVNWQAPELWVAHPRYNEKADVYSAALVFWECLQWHLSQKRYPFEGMNEHAIYQDVGHKHMRPSTATMRRQWGGDILDLVERMWAQDPKERPDMSEVVRDLEALLAAEKARARAAARGH